MAKSKNKVENKKKIMKNEIHNMVYKKKRYLKSEQVGGLVRKRH